MGWGRRDLAVVDKGKVVGSRMPPVLAWGSKGRGVDGADGRLRGTVHIPVRRGREIAVVLRLLFLSADSGVVV